MKFPVFESNYTNFTNDIFSLPLKIIRAFSNAIMNVNVHYYSVRTDGLCFISDILYLRLQIIGSRAIFYLKLREISAYENIISNIEPYQLIEIGYHHKQEELKKSHNYYNTYYNSSFLEKFLHKFFIAKDNNVKKNKIIHAIRIDDLYLKKNVIYVSIIFMTSSKLVTEIKLINLVQDKFLLEKISPNDLLRVGYLAKELEIELDNKITNFDSEFL